MTPRGRCDRKGVSDNLGMAQVKVEESLLAASLRIFHVASCGQSLEEFHVFCVDGAFDAHPHDVVDQFRWEQGLELARAQGADGGILTPK